jgi:hypothetical protein
VIKSGKVFDMCFICGGDDSFCAGCDGVPYSGRLFDACGVCNGDGRSCIGCDGLQNSRLKYDSCGICNGDNSTCLGCDGIPLGRVYDLCGQCGGNDGTCYGCDGVRFSAIRYDLCGVCGGTDDTCRGCDGLPRSLKKVDVCGVCGGNGTACLGCDGRPNSGRRIDACRVCGGDNSTCSGCDKVPNSMKDFDQCGVCDGDGKSCLGCDGMPFSGVELDRCGMCGGDNTGCSPKGLMLLQQPGGVVANSKAWLSLPRVVVSGIRKGNESAGSVPLLVRGLFVQCDLFDRNGKYAALVGTSMVTTDRSGIATFDNIIVPKGGAGFTFKFTATLTALLAGDASGTVNVVSEPFSVTIVTKVEPSFGATSGGEEIFVRVEHLYGVNGLTDLKMYFMTEDKQYVEYGQLVRIVPWDVSTMEIHGLTPVFPTSGLVHGVIFSKAMGPYRGIPFEFEFRWPDVKVSPPYGPMDRSMNTTMTLVQGLPIVSLGEELVINFGALSTSAIYVVQSTRARLELIVTPPRTEFSGDVFGMVAFRDLPQFEPRPFKYRFYDKPSVLSMAPNTGPLSGGTLVELVVKRFIKLDTSKQTDGLELVDVRFGAARARALQVPHGACCCMLHAARCCILHAARCCMLHVACCTLLHVACCTLLHIACCTLLHVAACGCMLLHAAACCMLHAAACCTLLHIACCCILHAARCCMLHACLHACTPQVLEVDASTLFIQVIVPASVAPGEVTVNISATQIAPGLERGLLSAIDVFVYKVPPATIVYFNPRKGTRAGGDVVTVLLTGLYTDALRNGTKLQSSVGGDKLLLTVVYDQRSVEPTVKYWDRYG